MRKIGKAVSIVIVLIMVCMAVAACGGGSKKISSDWPKTGLGAMLPVPEKGRLDISSDRKDLFSAKIEKTDRDTYRNYVEACKAQGFTVEAEEDNSSYSKYDAFNSDGYKLELRSSKEDEFSVRLEAPEEMEELKWPSAGLATLIPEPGSKTGKITKDSSDRFMANVADTTIDDYKAYGGLCYDYGFSYDYENGDDYYNAYNEAGVYLRLRYEGNNVMSISLEAPEETTAASETTAAPETQAPETAAPETQAPETQGQADIGIIRPEIKEAIDSYEAFIDEYCEFMKNYNASDLTMLAKYMELVSKELEMTKQFEDIENDDLNDAETAYFLEVELRCNQKLSEAAVNIAN